MDITSETFRIISFCISSTFSNPTFIIEPIFNIKRIDPLVYYARVVSPGVFKADGTIIQGTLVKDSIKIGNDTKVTIKDN